MAPKKAAPAAPSAEAREHVLQVIGASSEPATAAQIAKELEDPYKIRAAVLTPILEEFVASGRLHVFPGKTAKAQPRYWDRDALAIARAAALEAMRRCETPLTAKDLIKRIDSPLKLSERDLLPILADLLAEGAWHEIPPATAKGKPRYWNRDVSAYVQLTIQQTLRAKGAQTEASLKKAVKGVSDDQFQQSLRTAIENREVWHHPPLGKSKTKLLGHKPASPGPYLQDVGKQLRQVVARLTPAGVSLEELRRAVVQTAESAGIPFSSSARPQPDSAPAAAVPTFDLIARMKRIEPGAERGALVGARDLRRVAELGKQEFDRAVMELARQGRLSLHRHDYPSSLSDAEREELVSDGNGAYYVGMALRQG